MNFFAKLVRIFEKMRKIFVKQCILWFQGFRILKISHQLTVYLSYVFYQKYFRSDSHLSNLLLRRRHISYFEICGSNTFLSAHVRVVNGPKFQFYSNGTSDRFRTTNIFVSKLIFFNL